VSGVLIWTQESQTAIPPWRVNWGFCECVGEVRCMRVDVGIMAGGLFSGQSWSEGEKGLLTMGNVSTVVMQWMLLAIHVRD
jgi:hypothetical protein